MIKRSSLILIFIAMTALSTATVGWAANLIVNGDFELGNTDFDTDFRFKNDPWSDTGNNQTNDTGIWQPGTFTIAPNLITPALYHPDAKSYNDKTTGTGNYMAVNGITQGTEADLVWSQKIDASKIDANTTYRFSVWGSSWARSDIPGLFAVFIGDTDISGLVEAGTDIGVWGYSEFFWTSRPQDTLFGVTVQIFNGSGAYIGNDFALDDISLQVVPIPQTVLLLGTGLLFLIGLKRKIVK
jgi:hypothetical protein